LSIYRGIGGPGDANNNASVNLVSGLAQATAADRALAQTSEATAAARAAEAVISAAAAVVSASASAGSATTSSNNLTAALAAQTAAELALDSFDDIWLGAKSSNPAYDNDGNTLVAGAAYFNTSTNKLLVYSGAAWVILQDGITSLSGDTSPQLGGNLDLNNKVLEGALNLTGALNLSRITVASHATTADIWTGAGNQINWTGTVTTTAFPNAPKAGIERTLMCAGACSFTAGTYLLIDGVNSGDTITCAANDQIIVKAISTTHYRLSRIRYDGKAQVSAGGLTQASIMAYI
tara:strand:- start:157 stop:1032 length:876 start_codon:yes stop_codon:yes gene_type:complete